MNSGVLNATNFGIQLNSNFSATEATSATTDAFYGRVGGPIQVLVHGWGGGLNSYSATSNTNSNCFDNSNQMSNSGTLAVSNGSGVVFNAIAVTTSNSSGQTWNARDATYIPTGTITIANSATANVNSNTVTNTGTIASGYILLMGLACMQLEWHY